MAGFALPDRRSGSLAWAIGLSIALHAGAAVLNVGSGKARDPLFDLPRSVPLRLVPAAAEPALPAVRADPGVAEPAAQVQPRMASHAHPHPPAPAHSRVVASPPAPAKLKSSVASATTPLPRAALEPSVGPIPHGDEPRLRSAPPETASAQDAVAVPTPASSVVTSAPAVDSKPATASTEVAVERPAPIVTAALASPARASGNDDRFEPPHYNVAYLNNPNPDYPAAARRLRIQGEVIVRAMVDPAGRAGEVKIQRSSGAGLLDEAALRAVRDYRFVPARRGSEPVAHWVDVPFTFRLSD